MVYAEFGGQTECIMGNWKIENKIFTSNWLWIEIFENVVLSKIDITMTKINKKL